MTRPSSWTANRNSKGWSGGLAEWIDGNTAYLSVVFSWKLQEAYQRAAWLSQQGYLVRAGGPAVAMNPDSMSGIAQVGGTVDALSRHNPNATFTSRGCIRKCPFCAVPKIEGDLVELTDWPIRPIVCDNNFLACSRKHFDRVIDRLKGVAGVDFNQGLDARMITDYHAQRLAELDYVCIRFAWDDTRTERLFMRGFETAKRAGIQADKIRVYVLIGFNDTPDDALYRLEAVRGLGAYPNPMRYQPLDSRRKNEYVGPNWTDAELKRYMRYWANLRITCNIPFAEFAHRGCEPKENVAGKEQLTLSLAER